MLDMLARRSDQTYVVGPHIMLWARAFTQRADVTAEFTQVLDSFGPLPQAAITLSLLERDDVMVIALRNTSAVPRAGLRVGSRAPVPFAASGKAFLSHFSDREIEDRFEDSFPSPITKQAVQDTDKLIAQVRRCRVEGYAVEDEEVVDGHVSLASTVLDFNNEPIAAVSLTFTTHTQESEDREANIAAVKRLAEETSLRLGANFGQ